MKSGADLEVMVIGGVMEVVVNRGDPVVVERQHAK